MIVDEIIEQVLEPVVESLRETLRTVYKTMLDNLPADMPDEQRLKIMEEVMNNQASAITAGIKSVVPEDLANKLKEAVNGRK